jgi:hypothetical protein
MQMGNPMATINLSLMIRLRALLLRRWGLWLSRHRRLQVAASD